MQSQANKGVVAAGDRLTAAAGAEVLSQGGNAVDAAIAAMSTAFVAEPALTGPLGGGFAVVAAPNGPAQAYHFFARAPLATSTEHSPELDFQGLQVDFGSTQQVFHAGRGSTAVPLLLEGFKALHRDHGQLSLKDVLSQCRMSASHGIPLSKGQLNFIEVLTPILSLTEQSKKIYIDDIREYGQLSLPGLVKLIDALTEDRLDEIYRDMSEHFSKPTGLLSPDDFQGLQVNAQPPLVVPFRDHEIIMPGLPTSAGALIAFGLTLWLKLQRPSSLAEFHHQFAAVAAVTMDYRKRHFDQLVLSGETHWSLDDIDIPFWSHQLQGRLSNLKASPSPLEQDGHGSTTHVSVVDQQGFSCSMTTSNGEGCGHTIPKWDIMANNFMGEADLHPQGFHTSKGGQPLTSMMCPTVVRGPSGMYALGTGGSNRIRTALLQVIYRLLVLEERPDEAVFTPRAHYEGTSFCYEQRGPDGTPGTDLEDHPMLRELELTEFPSANMFFGGVHVAAPSTVSTGDLRRYGAVATASA